MGDLVHLGALVPVAALAGAYAAGVRRVRGDARRRMLGRGQVVAFSAGLVAVAVALAPPLGSMAEASLTAHMAQHVLLLGVAAPLLAAGAPLLVLPAALPPRFRPAGARWRRRLRRSQRGGRWVVWVAAALLAKTAALVVWHAPALFQAALRHPAVHAVEHAAFLLPAAVFWAVVVANRSARGAGVIAAFVGTLPETALGAAVTLAGQPWYPIYVEASTAASLQDQQIAGVVMWAFGGLVSVLAAAILFFVWIAGAERASPSPVLAPAPSRRAAGVSS